MVNGCDSQILLIHSDEVKLRQMISNLISNAIKYTEHGFVRIRVESTPHEARVAIEDSGLGIDPRHHQLIFNRFRRVEGDSAVKRGGLGLGLAITKAYADMIGARLELASELHKGSVFTLILPIER
jgi:signal transduction histidine kinase